MINILFMQYHTVRLAVFRFNYKIKLIIGVALFLFTKNSRVALANARESSAVFQLCY
jgi:hypothetical protein